MTPTKEHVACVFVYLMLILQNNMTSAAATIKPFTVRLNNSQSSDSNPMEGRLELFYNGSWGTVCYDGFTDASAKVACASLGFGFTGKFIGNRYRTGKGQIWLGDVICSGAERSIADCAHRPWGSHNCSRDELVSIKCGDIEDYTVRLVDPRSPSRNLMEGRLEMYSAGVWVTICSEGFTEVAAKIVCASLGYGIKISYEGTYISTKYYGGQTGPIWPDKVICTGREQSIGHCKRRPWGLNECDHNKDVSVRCGTARNFSERLVNSLSQINNPNEGRLEIYYSGSWGTVCDNGFTNASARVACAKLGFGYTGTVIGNRHGSGTGRIWLKDVVCTGTEHSIVNCTHSPWGVRNCTHDRDVSISCGITTRLVNLLYKANNPEEGRLEIYYAGLWGTVCDDNFTDINAKVACASLGFGYTGTLVSNRHGSGTGHMWLDNVTCSQNEQSIDMCSRASLGIHDCGNNKDVSIKCGDTPDFAMRLINPYGYNSEEGRLEIYFSGTWGTVCIDYFTNVSARVACASLGFDYVGKVIGNRYGGGTDPIWLDDVKCNGTESGIEQCTHRGWGVHNCFHDEDVSINCGDTQDFAVRLVNSFGYKSKEGRLEIYYSGIWGTVCNDGFSDESVRVVCDSLRYGYIGKVADKRHGEGRGPIWLNVVYCNGEERGIEKCHHRGWGVHFCVHSEDVAISCGYTSDFDIRLVNPFGNNSKEGRLEIYYSGIWGTVCDNNFTNVNARVACGRLGYGYVGKVIGNRYGGGTDPIWLDDVKCNGTESGIEQCTHRGWGVHNCVHDEDVSINCECANTLFAGLGGRISSPIYAGVYRNPLNCTYFIAIPVGHKAAVTFLTFHIEQRVDHWLKISCADGEAFNWPSYSGSTLPPDLIIKSCTLVGILVFALNASSGTHFSLDYEIIPDCGNSNYSVVTATISSPNYPNPMSYANGVNCTYFIVVPSTYKAAVTFLAFNTESPNDWLAVSCADGEAFKPRNFSGSALPSALTIPSCNLVRIWFHADYNVTKTSFSLSYKIVEASIADQTPNPRTNRITESTTDITPNLSNNALVVSILASLLGLCIFFVATVIFCAIRKTRQERDRVSAGLPLNTFASSEIDRAKAKTAEVGYEGLRSSGIYEHYDELNANEYQIINEPSESSCLKTESDPFYDEIDATDVINETSTCIDTHANDM